MAKVVPLKKLQGGEKAAAEPASMFDVKLALLDLANRPGREAEARSRLQELMSDDPKRAEPRRVRLSRSTHGTAGRSR